MASLAPAERLFTYSDYRTWGEGRLELIDGKVFDLSGASNTAHQRVIVALAFQVYRFFSERAFGEVFIAPFDVRLPVSIEPDDAVGTVVQPDVLVVCDPEKIDKFGCRGAPDWVIEVISPSTASKDQMLKRKIYERHGVREYWLVHPGDRTLTVYRPNGQGRYGAPEVVDATGTTGIELFPDLQIEWVGVFQSFQD